MPALELKRQPEEPLEPGAADAEPQPVQEPAPVADITAHLLRTRLRVAVESLETAERLLLARTGSPAAQEQAEELIQTARRELESLRSLVRADGDPLV